MGKFNWKCVCVCVNAKKHEELNEYDVRTERNGVGGTRGAELCQCEIIILAKTFGGGLFSAATVR